jgi:chromosome segregation ATPase
MAKIETGVDRLVELINKEKKISIDDAAKKLGISKVVIQEWADFLEEEKIISIDYAFSKTFLVERKLSKVEVKEKEKEYSNEKDAFVRKVENSLKNLEQDTIGFENIKNDFENIKKGIGGELEKVKSEVKELEKYEYLKKNLDKEIEQQVAEFHELLDKSHKEVGFEEKKHQAILEELDIEKREVELKEHRLVGLEEKEKELMNRIQALISLSKDVQKNVSAEENSIVMTEKRVKELEKSTRVIEENVKKKRLGLQPLLDGAKKHEEQILKLQDEILSKAKDKAASIKSKVEEGSKAVSSFEKFFTKKNEVEALISEISNEKKYLMDSFKL